MNIDSVWDASLGSFCDEIAGTNPAPAAVTASCAAAQMGLGLLLKVLRITGRRKKFAGDLGKLNALIASAEDESRTLRRAADEDVAAVRGFIGSHDPDAAKRAIEVPMQAARAARRGLDLCQNAADLIQGLPAADLGAGAILLTAALRAVLLSVDFNLRLLSAEDAFAASVRAERQSLDAGVPK